MASLASMASFAERVPLAPAIGGMFGAAAGVLVAATPAWLFERTMVSSGLATAPVGVAVQGLATVAALAVVGLAVALMVGVAEQAMAGPVVQEAAESDELDLSTFDEMIAVLPPRRPIFADRELGAPLMSDEALQTIEPIIEPGWEPEQEDMMPNALRAPDPSTPPDRLAGYTSIEELIRRLEIGMARRNGPPPDDPGGSADPPLPAAPKSSWIVREADGEDGDPSTRMQDGAAGRP